jgi:hypothetical protein
MINIQMPINSLSFGNVSFGILNELKNREFNDFLLFDIGNPDLVAFDKIREDQVFIEWVNSKRRDILQKFSKNDEGLKLWHISSSESSISKNQSLFTFHELDSITDVEKNILNNQKVVFVTSKYTKNVFIDGGVKVPVVVVPLGFDSLHFKNTNKLYHPKEVTHWSIFGKFEHRKRHEKTIRAWIKKFGGNYAHVLNLNIYNTFLKPEHNNAILAQIFENKPKPFNVNILPFSTTLSELNEVYNNTDIVIDMSGAEGFSLPSFTCVCLGKHAIVHNNTGIKEWANSENAVLIEPDSKINSKDGMFFSGEGMFNIGNIHDYNEDEFIHGLDTVFNNFQNKRVNEKGKELINQFSWKNCVDIILKNVTLE